LKPLNRLLHDNSGIIFAGVVAVTFIFLSSLIWLACALIVNRVFDGFYPILLDCDPRALATSQSALNAFGVSIVVVDVMFLVWWGLSSQRIESQESPAGGF
jgi:cellulose biosynthesis protein BcsQ